MGRRLDFHTLLLACANTVYFQPPVKMTYPCIVYERDAAYTGYSGNVPYLYVQRYMVTIFDRNPDSEIFPKVAALPQSRFQRHYAVENLNHDVFVIYF